MGIKGQKLIFSLLVALFLANILAWLAVFELAKPNLLEVNFFDVGQGDSFFIETPKRQQILIDGGPTSAILEKLGQAMPFWDRTIDLLILSHPEKDHLSGLIEILKRYRVENILWTGVIRDIPEYKEWSMLLQKEGAEIFLAKTGQKISSQGFVMEILYPFEELAGKEFKNSNNTSIVAKLVFGENSFLFTGDAEEDVEKELIIKKLSIDSDILKIAHHGSKTSSSDDFVKLVSPKIAVISAGKGNSYGHPHKEVLDVFAKYGIKILRTDLQGDIKIFSDGKNLKIE
jgi:competence protein ComEC